MMSYYYHHYHIYHHASTPKATADTEHKDCVDNSEEFHVYDHCRPIPKEINPPSRSSSLRNRNGNI